MEENFIAAVTDLEGKQRILRKRIAQIGPNSSILHLNQAGLRVACQALPKTPCQVSLGEAAAGEITSSCEACAGKHRRHTCGVRASAELLDKFNKPPKPTTPEPETRKQRTKAHTEISDYEQARTTNRQWNDALLRSLNLPTMKEARTLRNCQKKPPPEPTAAASRVRRECLLSRRVHEERACSDVEEVSNSRETAFTGDSNNQSKVAMTTVPRGNKNSSGGGKDAHLDRGTGDRDSDVYAVECILERRQAVQGSNWHRCGRGVMARQHAHSLSAPRSVCNSPRLKRTRSMPSGAASASDCVSPQKRVHCEHGRQRNRCKECGGAGMCEHGRVRYSCKECGGAGICEHGRRRYSCKECGGSAICEHGRQRCSCKECGGAGTKRQKAGPN